MGSREGKLCWFDMDLSSQPYRTLKYDHYLFQFRFTCYILVMGYVSLMCGVKIIHRCHPKDINNVAFHRSYPLFASCSDDCTAYVFHGMVYSDLNQNPLIVPLEILRGHKSSNGRGENFNLNYLRLRN